MKKLFLPFALVSIVACSSSTDDETQTSDASITGKWSLDKAEQYMSKNKETKVYNPSECEKKSIHEFRLKDMTSTIFEPVNNICEQTDVVTRKYTYNAMTKKFWYEGEEDYPYTISKLTSTDMVMEDHTNDTDGDGIPDVVKRYLKRIN
ncbi:lipocalin family protein [Chryseobacterium sp.]|uniref:lipocalin family protein n=1 Tax=Chryseobacterium sp. TaxID=1871047 RepID=UPI0025B8DC07|nr:lipocalin family protein [Chryseobacterium sp.]MBV8326163.1 lipocalin family protein [Chryseobacterium sp.]